jgi:malate permease and related proteins
MAQLFSVFLDVILPVFGIVSLGALIGGWLELQARSLTRTAYYVFVPAFIFQAISRADVPLHSALKMIVFIVLSHLLVGLVSAGVGRLLGKSKEMIAAFVMIAVFGNVGNYGLAIVRFRLGDGAEAPATFYFVAIIVTGFIVSVGAAGWAHGGGKGAVRGALKTPALWAAVPALLVSEADLEVPLMCSRMIGLLADGMIPVMLFALGLQLREQKRVTFSQDLLLASGMRLILAPALAFAVVGPFALGHLESASGILQAGMPTAILVAIISKENDIVPDFVTSAVVASTLFSLLTLPILMVLL